LADGAVPIDKKTDALGPIGASARQRNAGRRPYGGSSAAGGCWRTQSHSRRRNKNSPKHAGREIVLRERSNTCSARFCTGNSSRIALAALLAWTTIVDPIIAQTSQPPDAAQSPAKAPQSAVYSLTDLEYLLGPIALYPDPSFGAHPAGEHIPAANCSGRPLAGQQLGRCEAGRASTGRNVAINVRKTRVRRVLPVASRVERNQNLKWKV